MYVPIRHVHGHYPNERTLTGGWIDKIIFRSAVQATIHHLGLLLVPASLRLASVEIVLTYVESCFFFV